MPNIGKRTMFKLAQGNLKEVHGSDVSEKKRVPCVCTELVQHPGSTWSTGTQYGRFSPSSPS